MLITPLAGHVVVLRKKQETTTPGGIVLSKHFVDTQNQGTIVAVGEGRQTPSGKTVAMTVFVGDLVVFNPADFAEVSLSGDTYGILPEDGILAVIS
jgi:chaperonin GroES